MNASPLHFWRAAVAAVAVDGCSEEAAARSAGAAEAVAWIRAEGGKQRLSRERPEKCTHTAAQTQKLSRHQGLGAVFQRQKLQGKLNDAIKGEKLLLLLRFLRQKKQKGNCFFALFPAL